MQILALDPSSTATGWAVARPGVQILDAGVWRPPKALNVGERIDWMLGRMDEVLAVAQPARVIVEVPSGAVNARRHTGGGRGLSTYGYAVGRIVQALRAREWDVEEVTERWTGGHGKRKRKRVARSVWPPYAETRDAGGDIADAIALAVWWLDVGQGSSVDAAV